MSQQETHNLGKAAGNRGKGRPKGVPNKTTALLKDAILKAAEMAGGDGGTEGYLARMAEEQPGPFMALLGKVLPTQTELSGPNGTAIPTTVSFKIITPDE